MFSSSLTVRRIAIHVKSVYTRITLTHFTLAFFLVSLVSCVAQGALQAVLHSIDEDAANAVSQIVNAARVPADEQLSLTQVGDELVLKLCSDTPLGNTADFCWTVYQTGQDGGNSTLTTRFWEARAEDSAEIETQHRNVRRSEGFTTAPTFNATGGINGVNVTYSSGAGSVVLSTQCIDVLMYPAQILGLSKKQDMALFGSHIWLFAISCIALVYNSIPQLLVIICTRVLETAWSAFSVWRTRELTQRFNRLVIDSGTPCQFDPFPASFQTHIAYDLSELVLNVTVLICTCYIAWHLIKAFSAATIRHAGPPTKIIHMYHHFLVLFMFLQLSLFFVVTTVGLWMDQFMNSAFRVLSQHTAIYDALFIFTVVTIIPWMTTGWFAVHREMKYLMMLFLAVCFIYVACWAIMFYSPLYRYLFIAWPFFGALTVSSFIVLVGAAVFGVVCWHNFGRGLAEYLRIEAVLAKSDFAAAVFTHDVSSPHDESAYDLRLYRSGSPHKFREDWSVLNIGDDPVYTVDFVDTKRRSSQFAPRK